MNGPLRRPSLAVLIGVGLGMACGRGSGAVAAEDPEDPPKVQDGDQRTTNFFPLPLYATTPAEGSTYGVLPVFMRVGPDGQTRWITAPSASWNKFAGLNGTFRYYSFPRTTRQWLVIFQGSTKGNRSFRFDYRDVPGKPARTTFEVQALARRSLFYRYFGLGPDTTHEDQSSYTRELALLSVRGGLNLASHFNAGVRGGVRWDKPVVGGVPDLPKTQVLYPTAPGLPGGSIGTVEVSLRYDSRDAGDYDDRGFASELHAARDFGLWGSDSFWRVTSVTRVLIPEASFLSAGARLYWTDESGGNGVPFFYRSALGGDTLFRGFVDDRFIDRGAWELETEQRFRLFSTNLFHVKADWRADPFLAFGQVYPNLGSITSRVRVVSGIGLRAFVHPNILGRVDVAYGADGLVAYVLLGYPY